MLRVTPRTQDPEKMRITQSEAALIFDVTRMTIYNWKEGPLTVADVIRMIDAREQAALDEIAGMRRRLKMYLDKEGLELVDEDEADGVE